MSNKNVVIIGGGHGQALLCRSIKDIDDISLTAIVTVADDGGSTGRLRELFHLPAMGDIRNVLLALSDTDSVLAKLMNYRFANESDTDHDVLGHSLGNLIFTALANETGSFEETIDILSDLLKTKGKILPVTDQLVTLNALMEDGTRVRGEKNIPTMVNNISKVFYDVPVCANGEVIEALNHADLIIYGIGSLYTSILPNVIIPEINEALRNCRAPKVYFCNAMTQPGETDGYSLEDHVNALKKHNVPVDIVIQASETIPEEMVEKYLTQHSVAVKQRESNHDYTVLSYPMLEFTHQLVRHDSSKVAAVFKDLLERVR